MHVYICFCSLIHNKAQTPQMIPKQDYTYAVDNISSNV